jgi:hypothetical protein
MRPVAGAPAGHHTCAAVCPKATRAEATKGRGRRAPPAVAVAASRRKARLAAAAPPNVPAAPPPTPSPEPAPRLHHNMEQRSSNVATLRAVKGVAALGHASGELQPKAMWGAGLDKGCAQSCRQGGVRRRQGRPWPLQWAAAAGGKPCLGRVAAGSQPAARQPAAAPHSPTPNPAATPRPQAEPRAGAWPSPGTPGHPVKELAPYGAARGVAAF